MNIFKNTNVSFHAGVVLATVWVGSYFQEAHFEDVIHTEKGGFSLLKKWTFKSYHMRKCVLIIFVIIRGIRREALVAVGTERVFEAA